MAGMVPSCETRLGKSGRSRSKTKRFGPISRRNRQLGLGIEEMQPASLRRQANLIAARDDGFGGHAGGGDAGAAYPRLPPDLGAELFADLDPGIRTQAPGALAQHQRL